MTHLFIFRDAALGKKFIERIKEIPGASLRRGDANQALFSFKTLRDYEFAKGLKAGLLLATELLEEQRAALSNPQT